MKKYLEERISSLENSIREAAKVACAMLDKKNYEGAASVQLLITRDRQSIEEHKEVLQQIEEDTYEQDETGDEDDRPEGDFGNLR